MVMELLLLRINNSVSQGYITRSMNRKTSKLDLKISFVNLKPIYELK
jgi:ribosomal protein S17E